MAQHCAYRFGVSFRVQHEIFESFQIGVSVKKSKMKLSEDQVMLGSYPPSNKYKAVYLPANGYENAPGLGMGTLNVKMKFGNHKKPDQVVLRFNIKVVKQW